MVSKVRGTHKAVPLLLPRNGASANLQTLEVCWESTAGENQVAIVPFCMPQRTRP